MVTRYLRFLSTRPGVHISRSTHHHHILPKARDFFPEYKDLAANPWNGIHLTPREHFIAHWILARAFPHSSQARAFFHLTNIQGKVRSRLYEECRATQSEMVVAMTQDPVRNQKISNALRGCPKSTEQRQRLMGHAVSLETREKIRAARLGSTHTEESKEKMSATRTGKPGRAHTTEEVARMRATKLSQHKRWYNNSVVSKLFTDPPDATWVLGRLPWVP